MRMLTCCAALIVCLAACGDTAEPAKSDTTDNTDDARSDALDVRVDGTDVSIDSAPESIDTPDTDTPDTTPDSLDTTETRDTAETTAVDSGEPETIEPFDTTDTADTTPATADAAPDSAGDSADSAPADTVEDIADTLEDIADTLEDTADTAPEVEVETAECGDDRDCDDGDPCTAEDFCLDGTCQHTALECGDAFACTSERCEDGSCVVTVDSGCLIAGACITANTVDPQNTCRVCDPSAATRSWTARVGQICDDELACTAGETCNADGQCAGTTLSCVHDPVCETATCDGVSCNVALKDGWCKIDGACWQAGALGPSDGRSCAVCAPEVTTSAWTLDGARCEDADPCTMDSCGATGTCERNFDDLCCRGADGNYVPGTSLGFCLSCEVVGGSGQFVERTCNDGNPCTTDSCENEACVNEELHETACEDGDPCSRDDICDHGECVGNCECRVDADCAGEARLGNACQNVACIDNTCTTVPNLAADGEPCQDASPCTRNDVCADGECVSGEPTTCVPQGPCWAATCSPVNGLCNQVPLAAGASCDDRDACTTTDACDANGTCAGAALDCAGDYGECAIGMCVDGECQGEPITGTTCDDGDDCTSDDICGIDGCRGEDSSEADCGCSAANTSNCDDGLGCTLDYCDVRAGSCDAVLAQGSCLVDGVCYAAGEVSSTNQCRVCEPSKSTNSLQPVRCDDDDNACTDEVCRPATGCRSIPDDANTCDDGDSCSSNDHCVAGTCAGTCECRVDGDCQGTAPKCQRLACVASKCEAVTDEARDGKTCNDELYCTTGDTCSDGVCLAGAPRDCSALEGPCTRGRCDEAVDACVAKPRADGIACNDDDPCTNVGQCDGGICATTPVECIGDTCASGECDPTSGECTTIINEGTACNDGNRCTAGDTCNANGRCRGDWAVGELCECRNDGDCATLGDACHRFTCNPSTNACEPTVLTDAPCDDQNDCTFGDTCGADGACGGTEYACSDGKACTLDTCDGFGGCTNAIKDTRCLIAGICYAAGATNPTNPCEVCEQGDRWSGNDGASCDDGEACTKKDTCQGRYCQGRAYACPDYGCATEACDGVGGCNIEVSAPGYCLIGGNCVPTGSTRANNACLECRPNKDKRGWSESSGACDDGDACTTDRCGDGACVGTAISCDDDLTYTADSCDPVAGCKHDIIDGCLIDGTYYPAETRNPRNVCQACRPNQSKTAWFDRTGQACNDGLSCTSGDQCRASADGVMCGGTTTSCAHDPICQVATCSANGCEVTQLAGTCFIGGKCYRADDRPPASAGLDRECMKCAPNRSTTAWSARNDGQVCDDGDLCTGSSACAAGACVGTELDCDDGLSCTQDACTSGGACVHRFVGDGCAIDGVCVAKNAFNSNDRCLQCRPGAGGGVHAWSLAAPELACGIDPACGELSCAADTCLVSVSGMLGDDLVCYDRERDMCVPDGARVGECTGCDADDGVFRGLANQPCDGAAATGCIDGRCDRDGACVGEVVVDGTACDDASTATIGDVCELGVCGGFTRTFAETPAGTFNGKHISSVAADVSGVYIATEWRVGAQFAGRIARYDDGSEPTHETDLPPITVPVPIVLSASFAVRGNVLYERIGGDWQVASSDGWTSAWTETPTTFTALHEREGTLYAAGARGAVTLVRECTLTGSPHCSDFTMGGGSAFTWSGPDVPYLGISNPFVFSNMRRTNVQYASVAQIATQTPMRAGEYFAPPSGNWRYVFVGEDATIYSGISVSVLEEIDAGFDPAIDFNAVAMFGGRLWVLGESTESLPNNGGVRRHFYLASVPFVDGDEPNDPTRWELREITSAVLASGLVGQYDMTTLVADDDELFIGGSWTDGATYRPALWRRR